MYGINLCDLDDFRTAGGEIMIQTLLVGPLFSVNSSTKTIGKHVDDVIVIFDGPEAGNEDRVTACIEVIQSVSKIRMGRKIRCYKRGPRGGWRKI